MDYMEKNTPKSKGAEGTAVMTPNVLQQKLFDLAVECEKMSKEEISKALVALSNAKLDQALTIQGMARHYLWTAPRMAMVWTSL